MTLTRWSRSTFKSPTTFAQKKHKQMCELDRKINLKIYNNKERKKPRKTSNFKMPINTHKNTINVMIIKTDSQTDLRWKWWSIFNIKTKTAQTLIPNDWNKKNQMRRLEEI